jgi:hypothetical protein
MLRGLLHVRLKAAELALRDGRFDDAYRMAVEPDIAAHPRGVRLLAGLARVFVDRAREHYRDERFTEALIDLGKADRCGGLDDEVGELRGQVTTVAREIARQDADRRRRLDEARRCLDGGSIAAGKRLLESAAADDAESLELQKEIATREKRAADLLAQAEVAFKQDRTPAAVDCLLRARQLNAHDERSVRLETEICDRTARQAAQLFESGRLPAARQQLAELQTLGRHHAAVSELAELLDVAARAAKRLAVGDFNEAQQHVRRLRSLAPKTAWVKLAVEQTDRLDAALLALRSGPLGAEPLVRADEASRPAPANLAETVRLDRQMPRGRDEAKLPERLLLLVDGGGSYLLHRGGRVSIGRAASNDPADVPIFSDLGERHADVARVEEDYFLFSPHEVEVAGRRTRQQLLRDGDRVVLARRAKFTLRIPNRKSPSARMDISDSTKMPNDVRRVILFKDTAMIGRGPNCHITCHGAQRELVLFERGGGLWVRPQGRGGGAAVPVTIGEPLELEGASFVIQPWQVRTLGSSGII